MTKKSDKRGERRRVNLNLDSKLVEFVFAYTKQNDTTITQLITEYFKALRRQEEECLSRDAEQI